MLARAAALGIIGPMTTENFMKHKKGKKSRRSKKTVADNLMVSNSVNDKLCDLLGVDALFVAHRLAFSSRSALLSRLVPPHKTVVEHPSPFR